MISLSSISLIPLGMRVEIVDPVRLHPVRESAVSRDIAKERDRENSHKPSSEKMNQ